jgi:hypothetical protein
MYMRGPAAVCERLLLFAQFIIDLHSLCRAVSLARSRHLPFQSTSKRKALHHKPQHRPCRSPLSPFWLPPSASVSPRAALLLAWLQALLHALLKRKTQSSNGLRPEKTLIHITTQRPGSLRFAAVGKELTVRRQ